ncbi:tat pathway signal sequence [Hirsutella rhossiliensis]|uniref:Tat pathway signal sequence n=1 Tax=Hirsutella rhossiliensis TaxID=111463 RepID=A0A9P8N900_9HYPO|nr:tat pathway signal sequence [Hirsutella rhossiliensis]KAH0968201.1 tat pathway signal sequence [Hirsutella rhossiliensis]
MFPRRSDESLDEEHLLPVAREKRHDQSRQARRRSSKSQCFVLSIALNIVLCIYGTSIWVFSIRKAWGPYIPNEIYSPAYSAVEYETVVFTGGLHGDKSEYQGWSDEVNARWEALYNDIGISQIPADSAARLPNATTPIASDPTQYMVELDVFHQLHCLNLLRKLAYPDVFPLDLTPGSEEAQDNIYHMEHCYDQLRQSLQCSSDISTIYWEWSPKKSKMFGNLRTTHTCKNFAKIREWAVEHRLREEFDWFKKVRGAPIRHSE